MMRRRAMRRGPSLIGAAATTAVVVGTAGAVSGHQQSKQQAQAQAQAQDQAAQSQAADNQEQIAEMQQQMAAMQAQQVQAAAPASAPAAGGSDMMAQLQQLSQMKESGLLTDDEFNAAKGKLLGS
jgi:uncharacterized protein HemX